MSRGNQWITRAFLVAAATAVLYVVGAAFVGFDQLKAHLALFPGRYLAPLALLSVLNYLLRFVRWEWFLRRVGARIPLQASLVLYFAAYVMVITPGKIGEVFKAGLLRERYKVPLALGVPVVLAERIYDFLAVLALAAVGIFAWNGPLAGMKTGLMVAAAVPLVLVLFQVRSIRDGLSQRTFARPRLLRFRDGLGSAADTLGQLLGPGCSLWSLALSVAAWSCECLGMWLVCHGLGIPLSVGQAGFVYAAGTIVGSLSFMPGGLGGTEATMIWLMGLLSIAGPAAAAAAIIVRIFTLWLAVAIGLAFYIPCRSLMLAPGAATPDSDTTTPG